MLGVSRRLLYQIIARREIKSFRVHTKIVLSITDIESYMKERCIEEIDWSVKAGEILK